MDPEELRALGIEVDDSDIGVEAEPVEPRMQEVRRTVLDPIEIRAGETDAERSARPVRAREVRTGRMADADAALGRAPGVKAPDPTPEEQMRIDTRSRASLRYQDMSPGDRLREVAEATFGIPEAQRGLERHFWQGPAEMATGSSAGTTGTFRGGEAGVVGALQGLTLDHADEITSALSGQPIDETRAEMRLAEEQNPGASMTARGSAALLQAAAIPAAQGGMLARLGAGLIQGAGLGAIAGHGASEGDTASERWADAADAAPEGALWGAGGAVLGEGLRGMSQRVARAADEADRLRVASVATGTSRELGDTLMREAKSLPGGISALAERLRRLGIVPALGTADDVLERASEAADRLGSEGELGRIYDLLDEAAPVPRQRLLDSLLETAAEVERDPNSGRAADAVIRRAADWEQRLPEEMPYRQARDALRGLGDDARWVDPSTGAPSAQTRTGRQAYRGVRSALDDLAEEAFSQRASAAAEGAATDAQGFRAPGAPALDDAARATGAREADRFRQTRLDYQAAEFARDWAERALERLARNRGVSVTDYLAGTGASSWKDWLLRVVGNRAWRTREGTARATVSELLGRLRGLDPRSVDPAIRALMQRLGPDLARGAEEDEGSALGAQ